MSAFPRTTALKPLLLVAASALALAGCKIDNRPLLAQGEPPPVAAALPEPGPLGDMGEVPLVRVGQPIPPRAYPYAERAYSLDRAFYDMPPDYAFAYGDERPWVWEAVDDSYLFAEPYGDAYRYYYYEPGYDYPYFVRDADYGYAFGSDGALLALFDAAGALISASSYERYYPAAHSYWSRGYDLYQDFGRAPRLAVDPQAWREQAPIIVRSQQTWLNAPVQQPVWRAWRAEGGQQVAQRFADVRPARGVQNLPAPEAREAMRGENGPPIGGAFPRGRNMRFEQAEGQARDDQGAGRRAAPPTAEQRGRMAALLTPDAARMAEMARGRGEGRGQRGESQAPPAPPQALARNGGGHERRGGEEGPRLAQAPPQPEPRGSQGGRQGGEDGHEPHGGGMRVAQAAPPPQGGQDGGGREPHGGGAQSQPAPAQPHGDGGGQHHEGGGSSKDDRHKH